MIPLEPNTVYLTGFAREAVLSAILKWVDPILYVNDRHGLNLKMRKAKGSRYLGSCPWCHKTESLTFNMKTTKCTCSACNESGDLLDLVKEERVSDTQDALEFLTDLAEALRKRDAKRKAEDRQKRREEKKRFGDSYGMLKQTEAAR